MNDIAANEDATKHRMPVELGLCFSGGKWNYTIVWIPESTRPCNVKRVAWSAYMDRDLKPVVEHFWVQSQGPELRAELQ